MSASGSNNKTLQSYNDNVDAFLENTPKEVPFGVKNWIDVFLDGFPKEQSIFEIGSAFGRDATYIQSKGYSVQCSDAAPNFVELLREQGFYAINFNLLEDAFQRQYDLIIANAVLPHLTREEFEQALNKTRLSLNEKGIFAFTLKVGDGEVWLKTKFDDPRFFCFWQKEDVETQLEKAGFSKWEFVDNSNENESEEKWLFILATK